MKRFFAGTQRVHILLLTLVLLTPIRMFGVGWTPTDAGLVVNLEQGERFLLSVWVDKNSNGTEEDGEEFFVSNYNRFSGDYYDYSAGSFMKLLPATEITEMNEWSVGAPLNRGNKALGAKEGTVYTIWNDSKTLKTSDSFKFLGDLTSDYSDAKACDVVFVIPTERGVPVVNRSPDEPPTSFDPNNTLKRGTAPFNGRMGTGFLGMTYREVYMFEIPKANSPQSYTNAGLVTFNTTLSTWKLTSGAGDIAKGKAAYAYADSKHDKTPRTLFRLYLLDNPINSCSSYFFATDEQDDVRYRMNEDNPQESSDSTAVKTIYTMDRLMCMSRRGSTEYYETDLMRVPEPDNTYYYVGYNNTYIDDDEEAMGTNGAQSNFTQIRELPMFGLSSEFKAPAGVYGRMVADATSEADNLGVGFEPVGYFLRTSSNKNVRMHKTGDYTWTSEEMWTITDEYDELYVRTMLMTGLEFSETDTGAVVEGWSKWVQGKKVPVSGGGSIVGKSGYAQITVNNNDSNGHMVFILADNSKWIRYHNNGFMGLEIPKQYPLDGVSKVVTIMEPRINPEYTFLGWNTKADGSGDTLHVGDKIDFESLPTGISLTGDTALNLYALARYDGTFQMAISFIHPTDGKRYFLTHPNTSSPRYARARTFENWDNVWQGMDGAENTDPNYVSTYEAFQPEDSKIKAWGAGIAEGDKHLTAKEHVLDPRHYTMKGYTDSLTFYEYFMPNEDEFIGLYYTDPNAILANNTWSGLFTTTSTATPTGWPDYKVTCIESTKLKSERYLEEENREEHPDSLTLKIRSNSDKSFVKYNAAENKFDGVATEGEATDFQISAVVVADEHYIIIPDTTKIWRDTITFGAHHNNPKREAVWSSLIGKQLMAALMAGSDTAYFHPNRDKIINDPNDLYLSKEFRVTQSYELIRDSRVSAPLSEGDSVTYEATGHYWHNDIISGNMSPINVKDGSGNYIDIIDTFRITLSLGGISKVKDFRGRWKNGAAGLHVNADGSRYRDVIICTKTYHYADTIVYLTLTPELDKYSFNPLADNSRTINFTLKKIRTHKIKDVNNNVVSVEAIDTIDVTSNLALGPGACSFSSTGSSSSTYFSIYEAVSQRVTLTTRSNNNEAHNVDTLKISTSVTIDAVTYPVTASVPLEQTSLAEDELIWSVYYNNQRYYIMAGTGGLIFRKYTKRESTLYQENSNTKLVKGSANAANSDKKYITPWHYSYNPEAADQLALHMRYGVNRYIKMSGDAAGAAAGIHATDSSFFTYQYADVLINENANFEEQVKLKYGADKWLKFTGSALVLTSNENEASVFSWSYLKREYSMYQKNAYPNVSTSNQVKINSVTFGYNTTMNVSIQTRYKAIKEFTMLVGNEMVNLCREDEDDIADLINAGKEWKTSYDITLIPDARTFDAGSTPNPAVSGLSRTTFKESELQTTISTSGATTSPLNVKIDGKYVNIVDTLHVTISLTEGAPNYKFINDWSSFKSIEDAELKIPLIRKTYHTDTYDSIVCTVEDDEYNYTFPNSIEDADPSDLIHTFTFGTEQHTGSHVLDVDNTIVAVQEATTREIDGMDLRNKNLAEVRLIDEFGKAPDWCRITGKGENTVTVQCTKSGIRSPRLAYIYIVYIVTVDEKMRFVNFRVTVTQPSLYQYANNQILVHRPGASGDPVAANGMQQVHENKRILYYYPEQNVELPVRESHFFGWWRWFREGGTGIGDTDIPEGEWRTKPLNMGGSNKDKNNYNYPFRIIGDSVLIDEANPSAGKKLVTNGRYTVFHYKSSDYNDARNDPPCKTALVAPPTESAGIAAKPTVTYAVDISNYYDGLPMSLSQKNQVDTARLDTMRAIPEPTLSLREVFELRPWTEMADIMDDYKSLRTTNDAGAYSLADEHYMEDHVVMAPLKNQLLLSTEQRYNKTNLEKFKHSESLLCYYMHDDNWSSMSSEKDKDGWSRQDSMIWCGGWDADCLWYTYDPETETYTRCTHNITEENDFLIVPAKENIADGQEFETVYYCLRARSRKTETAGTEDDPDDETPPEGDYMFNICRYKVIYHDPNQYGPKLETLTSGVNKALITNDEIEQNYEVLERLNFDYNKPGSEYQVYPHPLPWSDASYGYTYPETSDLPHNRLHKQSDFPNMGEYGLINRIPDISHWGLTEKEDYWYPMEQHGGAENGYMIYCDGMSSAGQVAALSLTTQLCEGQKMYFSAYVGNCSKQGGKSKPNFTFSVQGSVNGSTWDDITTYMTGDLQISSQWYQIFFPVNLENRSNYEHFRVRIYNMSSSWDGNDFVIDDMCLFATKPPLIAYQANTECVVSGTNDSITQVVLRVDYQGITNDAYNGKDVYYTIQQAKNGDTSFVKLEDHYMNEVVEPRPSRKIYGHIPMPTRDYEPTDASTIFSNLGALVARVEESERDEEDPLFRQGYIYEEIDGEIRPVMYIIHKANMAPDINYKVRMSLSSDQLTSSICAMTSEMTVTSHVVLELNGEEQPGKEVVGMCANTTYDIAMRVKGSLYPDNAAPIDLNGSCQNDWLLYGDTAQASSKKRYGYYYRDIVKVVKDILRAESTSSITNANQYAPNLSSVSRNEMIRIQNYQKTQGIELSDPDLDAYTILSHLVNNGFLTLYKPKLTASLMTGDSLMYVVFPIVGTGSDALHNANVDVCPNPMLIKLKPEADGTVPMVLGGIYRDSTQTALPIGILANSQKANERVSVVIKSIASGDVHAVAIHSIELRETDDPEYLEGIHTLRLLPDKEWIAGETNEGYYSNNDSLHMRPAEDNNYTMRAGYNYIFNINLMTRVDGSLTVDPNDENSCRVGIIPFTLSVVPDYIRWEPKSEKSSAWNNPDNWIGVNAQNVKLHDDAHFAPLTSTSVIIPAMEDGLPYPVLPNLEDKASYDSIKQIGFEYNKCNVIRFLPGAAMAQQQRMNYNAAVIDMSTPQGKWALRSTPVTGLLGGDIFMANADLNNETSPWEVGDFDASGRNNTTGNASFWISLYNSSIIQKGDGETKQDSTIKAAAQWSKATNNMKLSLQPASGWAVFTRTVSGKDAVVRLPKNDDIYYYFDRYGNILYDIYEQNLRTERATNAGGADKVGKLAFHPDGTSQNYTLNNSVSDQMFVFGNPTMGYIDIWGFIADNNSSTTKLTEKFDYMSAAGRYTAITKSAADDTKDTISNPERYLPPMHAIVLYASSAATSLSVTLNANRVITSASQIVRASAPARRSSASGLSKGIMTVTAINPVSPRCTSRLLIGQGYHNAVREGEDAILTTVNIDNYTNTSAPATPFNIYATEGDYGLSIDLRDEVVNIPVSFYMSDLPYDDITELWFTGVNNIDGELVLYDALTGSERTIADGICIKIPTPEQSHETRYYIRRRGFDPNDPTSPIATGIDESSRFEMDGASAVKIINNGHVFILRDGHVYSIFGQKLR